MRALCAFVLALLHPFPDYFPTAAGGDPGLALNATSGAAEWDCFIGGRNITVGDVLVCDQAGTGGTPISEGGKGVSPGGMTCTVIAKAGMDCVVRCTWGGGSTLGQVLEAIGRVPLPPYIKREAGVDDLETYQNVHAANDGSVAAPTVIIHALAAHCCGL